MQITKVKDVMTPDLIMIAPDASLKEAGQQMAAINCGVLPVGRGGVPEGMITDRDIVIRAVSKGKDMIVERVRDCMTPDVYYCNSTDTLSQAASVMSRHKVSRLLVKDESGDVCGIVTFGCFMRKERDTQEVSEVVECSQGRKAA